MPLSSISGQYYRSDLTRFEQGDVLRDLTVVQWAEVSDGEIDIQDRLLSYCVLLSQDCDLEHDFNSRNGVAANNDKFLTSALLIPAYPAETFRAGTHLATLSLSMQRHSTDAWKRLKGNNEARYHFLNGEASLQVPELVLDFKHYLTIPRDVLYRGNNAASYLATIEVIYREQLSLRFASYLSRIGLPEPTSD